MNIRDEIQARFPKHAARAQRSAKSAIRLFCIECYGGDAGDARRCPVRDCFLWPHVKAWQAQRQAAAPPGPSDAPALKLPEVVATQPVEKKKSPFFCTKETRKSGPPLDRSPGALVGKTLRRVEADGQVRECVVTERGFEYGGVVYTSISAAAKAASGRKAENGWEYWR